MFSKYVGDGADSKWAASLIVIRFGTEIHEVHVYATNDSVDKECHRLSKAMPEATVMIQQMARIRAVYEKGERTVRRDLRSFYDNISDDEYKETLILNSKVDFSNPDQPHFF